VKTVLFQKDCLPVLVVRGRRIKSRDFKFEELTIENLVPFLKNLDENYKFCLGHLGAIPIMSVPMCAQDSYLL